MCPAIGLYPGGNIFINRDKLHSAPVNGGELRISGHANIDLGIASSGGPALGFGTGDGSPGSSVLSIVGPDATISIDSIRMANLGAAAPAPGPYLDTNRIRFIFDETGVSTINLTGTFAYDPGTGEVEVSAILAQGKLEVIYTGSTEPALGANFDLMVGDFLLQDPTFALDPAAAANWSLAIVGTQTPGDASNDVLRLTFIGGPLPQAPLSRRCVTPCKVSSRHEDAVSDAGVEVHVVVERRAEAVEEGDAAEPRAGRTRRGGVSRDACRSA
jgi:hypothetical protein